MKLSALAAGLGIIGLAALGIGAVGGLATGNIEITNPDLDAWIAQLATGDVGDPTEPGVFSSQGVIARWISGLPIGWAFTLVILVRYAGAFSDILMKWNDEAIAWSQALRSRRSRGPPPQAAAARDANLEHFITRTRKPEAAEP